MPAPLFPEISDAWVMFPSVETSAEWKVSLFSFCPFINGGISWESHFLCVLGQCFYYERPCAANISLPGLGNHCVPQLGGGKTCGAQWASDDRNQGRRIPVPERLFVAGKKTKQNTGDGYQLTDGKTEALRGHLACARSYGHTKNSLSCVRCTPMREPVRKGIKTHPQISGIYEEL